MDGIRFEIVMSRDGQLKIHGPIHDKILCLGMLEMAKNMVNQFDPKKNGNVIVPVEANRIGGL